jgi:hypothetical protein
MVMIWEIIELVVICPRFDVFVDTVLVSIASIEVSRHDYTPAISMCKKK